MDPVQARGQFLKRLYQLGLYTTLPKRTTKPALALKYQGLTSLSVLPWIPPFFCRLPNPASRWSILNYLVYIYVKLSSDPRGLGTRGDFSRLNTQLWHYLSSSVTLF